jgi:hypothetical protein
MFRQGNMSIYVLFRLLLLSMLLVSVSKAAADPWKELKNQTNRLTGVDLDRPRHSRPGPPAVVRRFEKATGTNIPSADNPVALPPKPPLHDLIQDAANDIDSISLEKLKPDQEKQAEGRIERLKLDIKAAVKEVPQWITLLAQALIIDRKFPDPYGVQTPSRLPGPSVELHVSETMINSIIAEWLSERFPLENKGFVEISDASFELDRRNVIVLHINRGRINYKLGISHTPHIKGGTLELVPVIWKDTKNPKKTERIALAFRARCTALDIESCPGEIDRVLAHVVTKFFDTEYGVGATDLTKTLSKPIEMGVLSNNQLIPNPKEVRAYIAENHLTIQADLEFGKAPKETKPVKPSS